LLLHVAPSEPKDRWRCPTPSRRKRSTPTGLNAKHRRSSPGLPIALRKQRQRVGRVGTTTLPLLPGPRTSTSCQHNHPIPALAPSGSKWVQGIPCPCLPARRQVRRNADRRHDHQRAPLVTHDLRKVFRQLVSERTPDTPTRFHQIVVADDSGALHLDVPER